MIHSDEMFMQHQEQNFTDEDRVELMHNNDLIQEQQAAQSLPVIDMNTLAPSEEIMSIQGSDDKKEIVNITSVDMASQIINSLVEGNIDPLSFMVRKKLIVDAMEIAAKDPRVKAIVLEEVGKYGKQGASCLGATLKLTSRKTYVYAADPTWKTLKESIAETEQALKVQEEKIKIAVNNNASLVGDGGEIIASIVPAPETVSVSVSFSKRGKK